MIPIDIQVSKSKVKVIGHVGVPRLVQLMTQERFAPEASILVDSPLWVDDPYWFSGH